MALLGESYAHCDQEIVATETEKTLRTKSLQARKQAETLLPYKRIRRRSAETTRAVYETTYGNWNRVWLQRQNDSEDEAIVIMMDRVSEDVLLSFNGKRGMGRYRPRQLGLIEKEGRISIAGNADAPLQAQLLFVEDLHETLSLIQQQQQAEKARHFIGRLALNG